ncbi:MAG: ABC transporter ATP-binding protein [Methylobacteriaceae bacterium]|nr:ABC transporter ATP-binding protein [Methylobacteriaceae bacterium]
MLEVERIESGYGRTRILKGVDLQLYDGEVVAIVGPNGAGKTTLLRTISGLVTVHAGEIRFEGERITRTPAHRIARRGIGHCPEGRRIFQRLTVEENLVTGFIPGRGRSYADLRAQAFALFPILAERRASYASRLSGGQQQMLAVARSLMAEPRLLMLDEPSLGLAPLVVNQILEIVLKLAESGVSIMLVEQKVNFALEICDYAYVLENGYCTMAGPGAKLLADPLLREAYLPKV